MNFTLCTIRNGGMMAVTIALVASLGAIPIAGCSSASNDDAAADVVTHGDDGESGGAGESVKSGVPDDPAEPDTSDLPRLADEIEPIPDGWVPDGFADRARSDLSASAADVTDEDVAFAAAMLYHLEDKYVMPFSMRSVQEPFDGNGFLWVGVATCEDEAYSYGKDDPMAGLHLAQPGDPIQVGVTVWSGGENPEITDDMVLQVASDGISSEIEDATRRALEGHGFGLDNLIVGFQQRFKRESIGKANELGLDATPGEIIPLIQFDAVATAMVDLPDGMEPLDAAESVAKDLRDAYGEIGISDAGDTGWKLTMMFRDRSSSDAILYVTSSDILDKDYKPVGGK